jgi:hypothetical protein
MALYVCVRALSWEGKDDHHIIVAPQTCDRTVGTLPPGAWKDSWGGGAVLTPGDQCRQSCKFFRSTAPFFWR